MRYGPEHKSATHERIVKNAARQFRLQGLNGAGVAQVMRASGLTVGGFYKHFRKRDDLVAEAVGESLREVRERLLGSARQAPAGEAWRQVIRTYLSMEHCDHPDAGCPIAALAPEISRAKPPVKKRIEGMLKHHREEIMRFAPGNSDAERERNFMVTFSAMAGAIALARTVSDPAEKQRILATVRDHLLCNC